MDKFRDQVAVITGGASGFGKEFARLGASLGMKLVLADIEQGALDATVAELQATGAAVIARRTDVSKAADVQALADAAVAAFGQVNLLFNNAGVAPGGLVWESTEQDWNWALGVNLHGAIHGLRVFTPLMLAAAQADPGYRGHIVNTASMAGLTAAPTFGLYCVSKQAVVALSETLFHDLGLVSEQVKCSVLCPSFVATGINRSQRNRPADGGSATAMSRSQLAAQAMLDRGIAGATISAEDVARITFDAIRDDRFYIFPQPQSLATVQPRFDDILGMHNPRDPFGGHPEIRAAVIAALGR
ncbi:SDR family oxidoreductase (plasmid) [Cupriavidus sp. KK10]|jgi:NAD(P)-dependent dehydrogenase (short-subunit alcohol dehydrogenase family)|uniref:SDR family oxidoreductase n=1 Tax=Cupriavidus sp. KK10 TaxID=1478019 RepID=UPI001BA45652|nr:SDR family oxidoreductase [Cupriavidus sp. KK10]QUN31626.1 SDR family oxidoreductase [Cupriavidus sp. KK10]